MISGCVAAMIACAAGGVTSAEPFTVRTWEGDGPVVEPWRVLDLGPHAGSWLVAGDLTGDGRAEIVCARNDEQAVTAAAAYDLDGKELWTWGEAGAGSPNWSYDVPLQLYDLDADGRAEVFLSAPGFLVVLEGATGRELRRHPLPEGLPVADCITFADLSGVGRPTDILVKTRYTRLWAYTAEWKPLWTWAPPEGFMTIHHPEPMDLDGDGRDEILAGYTLLGPDGNERWTFHTDTVDLRRGHLDCAEVLHTGQGGPDQRAESARIAVSCCGANLMAMLNGRGEVLWEAAGVHFESIDAGPTGAQSADGARHQVVVDIDHTAWNAAELRLYSSRGELLGTYLTGYARHHRLIDWDGDGDYEILLGNARALVDGTGECVAVFVPGAGREGAFDAVARVSEHETRDPGPFAVVGDMDGDGRNEVVLHTADTVWIYRSTSAGARGGRLGTGVNWTLY